MYPPYHSLSASATPICRSSFSSLNQIKITHTLVTYLSEKLIHPLNTLMRQLSCGSAPSSFIIYNTILRDPDVNTESNHVAASTNEVYIDAPIAIAHRTMNITMLNTVLSSKNTPMKQPSTSDP